MSTETIEGTATIVREDEPQRALAVVPEQRAHLMSGLGAVALLSDEDFERNLALLTKGKARAQAIQKAILTDGVDYGREPGIDRPFLHKPGAEVMEKAYGFATSYTIERKVGDGVDVPALEYIVHAKVHLGDTDGPVIAEGVGSCNTHESKYRFRRGERECPSCGKPAIIKGKADGKLAGKWWCAAFKDGCGKTFEKDDPRLVDQQVGNVENENPYDLANTILKMARKRAGVDAILTATGTSGLFTQDADSPAVQPRGGTASGGDGGEPAREQSASRSAAPRPAGGSNQLPKMPAAGSITESTMVAEVRLNGLITITDKQRTDGELRNGKAGPTVGFQFDWANGGKIASVVAHGELAEQIAELHQGDTAAIHGIAATIAGGLWADPWSKKNDEGIEEPMPPARRLVATSIETDHWTLPRAAQAAPAEAPKAKGKAAEPKQTTVADAAHEAGKPAGPGMTADAFKGALDAARIGGTFALEKAKERFGVETLFALTDPQRLELASELGLLTDEEE